MDSKLVAALRVVRVIPVLCGGQVPIVIAELFADGMISAGDNGPDLKLAVTPAGRAALKAATACPMGWEEFVDVDGYRERGV